MTQKTAVDKTDQMKSWIKGRLKELAKENLCVLIFKSKSPSSGLYRIRVYGDDGSIRKNGTGLFAKAFKYGNAVPGGVIAVQTFGDFQNFNPHLHIIATDGCFYGNGMFIKGPAPAAKDLEDAFRREVFALLKKEGMITDFIIDNRMR